MGGEAAKYGQDIVLLAAFTNAQKSFEGWIGGAEKKIVEGYPSPNNMEEATTMVNNCKMDGWDHCYGSSPRSREGKFRQDDPACRSRRPLHHNEGQVGEGGRGGQGLDKETGRALWDVVQADRNAEQGDKHYGGWGRPRRRRTGEPE